MALRAGYYGVKRRIWEAIQTTTAKIVDDIDNIWKNHTVSGAKNILPNAATTSTITGVTFTVNSDKSITLSGENTGESAAIKTINTLPYNDVKGKILSGVTGGSSSTYMIFGRIQSGGGGYLSEVNCVNGDVKIPDNVANAASITFNVRVFDGVKFTESVNIYPMIRDVNDPDATYAPFAMTNQELTASANDQKTAINAIISASTSAADFAAFKTAMAAITPVTRSATPDERSLDVEVEEPVVVKKTTRKKTKTEEEE